MRTNISLHCIVVLLIVFPVDLRSDLPSPEHSSNYSVGEKCPVVIIECPCLDSGKYEPLIFNAIVKDAKQDSTLEYAWTLTGRGRIKNGQGTASVTIDAERNGTGIGILLEVKGLPDSCDGKASYHISHY